MIIADLIVWLIAGSIFIAVAFTTSRPKTLPAKPDYHAIEAMEREILGDEYETIVKWDIEVFGVYAHACPGCPTCKPPSRSQLPARPLLPPPDDWNVSRKGLTPIYHTTDVMEMASDALPDKGTYTGAVAYAGYRPNRKAPKKPTYIPESDDMMFCGKCGVPEGAHQGSDSCRGCDDYFRPRPFHVPEEATGIDIEDGAGKTITRVWTWYEMGEKMSYKENPISKSMYEDLKGKKRAPSFAASTGPR